MKFIKYAYQFNRAKVIPTHLEKKYVHHTYNLIAQHFDHTRFAVWPRVKEFIDALEEGSLIYDIGCGNGKYFHDSNKFMLGTDVSPNLLDYALKRNEGAMLMASDILKLPIRTQSCDAVLCIAVLHHLSTKQTRIQALSELSRILKVKGKGLIYVWCYQQVIKNTEPIPEEEVTAQQNKDQDMLIKWHLQQKYATQISENIAYQHQPLKNSVIVKRYYHLYKQGELQQLISAIPQLRIIDAYHDKENWCCIIEKQ